MLITRHYSFHSRFYIPLKRAMQELHIDQSKFDATFTVGSSSASVEISSEDAHIIGLLRALVFEICELPIGFQSISR